MSFFSSFLFIALFLFPQFFIQASEYEIKKTHLEDIFIWKMSDELKLSAQEEKSFTEINKNLNRQKSDLNREIQDSIAQMSETDSEAVLKNYKKLIIKYNQLSLTEFDSIKKLLGTKKFISYLKIKSEINTKLKNILIGDKSSEKKEVVKLPPPQVIIEN
jgi:DNA anti-recombination protein RmuC